MSGGVVWVAAEGIGVATVGGVSVYTDDRRSGLEWEWGTVDGDESTELGRASTQAAARAAAEMYARDFGSYGAVEWAQRNCGVTVTAEVRGYHLKVECWPGGWVWVAERGHAFCVSEHNCASKTDAKRRAVTWATAMADSQAPAPKRAESSTGLYLISAFGVDPYVVKAASHARAAQNLLDKERAGTRVRVRSVGESRWFVRNTVEVCDE